MAQATATQRGTDQDSDKTAIRPFQVNVPETELTELRRRLKRYDSMESLLAETGRLAR